MRIFSHPFRLTKTGSIASVEQYSVQATAEQIAMIILTEKGERQMLPNFGLIDPAFTGIDLSDVSLQVSLYGPDVNITSLNAYYVSDSSLKIDVEFADAYV